MKILLIIVCICAPMAFANQYADQTTWGGVCNAGGSQQSPINIPCQQNIIKCPAGISYDYFWRDPVLDLSPTDLQDLKRFVKPSNGWLRFSNQTNDYLYKTVQFHIHTPSQHLINGKSFDLQIHVVHLYEGNPVQDAVLVLLFDVDDSLEHDILEGSNLSQRTADEDIYFPIHLRNTQAYYYRGSFTTPPCTQIVNFFVQKQTHKITRRTYNQFKKQLNDGRPNNRLTQRLGNRKVYQIGNQCTGAPTTGGHE